MRAIRILAVLMMLALLAAGCQNDDNPVLDASPGEGQQGELDEVVVPLEALNDSGQSGQAVLTPEDGKTRVVVTLENSPPGPQPIHIHPGTCEELDPKPAYPLESVVSGRSESVVDISLDALLADDFAINVHKSPEEADVYVSCGQISA